MYRERGQIVRFEDYSEQDHDTHAAQDAWTDFSGDIITGKPTKWSDDSVKAGFEKAVAASKMLFLFFYSGTSVEKVRSWLDTTVFELDETC